MRRYMQNTIRLILFSSLVAILLRSPCALADANSELKAQAQNIVTQSQLNTFAIEQENKYWNLPLFMGSSYVSQYYLFLHWLGLSLDSFDIQRFQKILLDSQMTDGSWQQVHDANLQTGSLDATIANYWALKVMGIDVNSLALANARQFILQRGGIPQSTLFTKIMLALFRNYDWIDLPKIPAMIFKKMSILVSDRSFAQWVRPHLLPIAYLSGRMVSKNLGPSFHLAEIGATDVEKRLLRPISILSPAPFRTQN